MSSPYMHHRNGGGNNGGPMSNTELTEEHQNGHNHENNWPFSVRYTASPYRKSKYAPPSHSPASNPHSPAMPNGTHGAQIWPQGLGRGHGYPWNQMHHANSQSIPPGHFITPPLTYKLNQYVHSHEVQLHHHHPQMNPIDLAKLQQMQMQNANHFLELKQHHEHQQQLIHQNQRQYDHHHYGLPVSTIIPPEVILQASQATLNKTMGIEAEQQLGNGGGGGGGISNGKFFLDKQQHFRIRYPQHPENGGGGGGRQRVISTNFNQCNTMEQVEGLDEGYIEELKHPLNLHNPGINGNAESNEHSLLLQQQLQHLKALGIEHPHPNGQFDPYSYVYDSQLIKEDLSVCSASVNQVFLNKSPYQHPPEGYSKKAYNKSQRSPEVENEYEEIRDVQRYMNITTTPTAPKSDSKTEDNDKNDKNEEDNPRDSALSPIPEGLVTLPKHFKSFSTSTDDILAEVVQVKQKHDRVLDQLNLEVENLLLNSSVDEGRVKDQGLLNGSGGGSYSNLVKVHGDQGWMSPSAAQCPFGGSLRRSAFGRKSKGSLDRGEELCKDEHDSLNKGSSVDKCGKMQDKMTDEDILRSTKLKSKYPRSMSLIPNWKIRDHLMRLPFLRHHHDKVRKSDSSAGIPHSKTVSGLDFHKHNNPSNNTGNNTNNKGIGGGAIMSTATATTGPSNGEPPAALKTRSSSMDELRSTGEEHWYSADSDTDPDSLTAIPPPIPPAHSPPSNPPSVSTISVTLNSANPVDKVNSAKSVLINSSGNIYSNFGDCNGSRMELANNSIGNGIPDVPKAPKFRRPAGLKDKWRESWSSSTKTLIKSSSMEEDNRLLRWFSLRKNSASMDPSSNGGNRHSTLPQLTEEDLKRISFMEDEEGYWPRRTVQPPSLPPPPPELSGEQIKRRHIIAAIVHSENSYVAALQRLVNEYKKPLECSHPAILSHSKISAVFHRVPEILQCHSLFRIALAECVRKWDLEEKIGDVFVASFSKSLVLDVYSEFINNFGTAMETAKLEARRKSSFAEFLKVKQMTAHDRLSLFGLMVKPVQRFPQFILLLQDLLKHTPREHHDRMSLQLALTQLESLAAMLNERKRESEQYLAFRETIKSIGGGKFVLLRSIVDDPNRILLRQDLVTQLEFDGSGSSVAKSKSRKLLLLNDMLICTTSNTSATPPDKKRTQEEPSLTRGKSEKSVFKWSYPVQNVEVEDISISPTMSRFVHRSSSVGGGVPVNSGDSESTGTLLEEMQSLMHDYEVLSRVLGLVSSLKTSYEGLSMASVKDLMLEIQHQIRQRDEQISYFDSSCLTLLLGTGREKLIFQMQSPQARTAWIEELRLAQLALDPNNSPAWDIPQESPYPLHKLPLFVKAVPLCKQPHLTIVKCGCYFTHTMVSQTGRSKIFDYLWVSSTDGMSSHLTAFRCQQNALKEVTSLDLVEEKVNDMLFVRGHIWVATESRKIMLFDPGDTDKGAIAQQILTASVLKLLHYNNTVYAGLADGHIAIFTELGVPCLENLCPELILQVGNERIVSLFGSKESVYAACGNSVVAVSTTTHIIERSVVLNHHIGSISHMACSGVGLWITTAESETVCLYHLESFQHLQDVSIRPSVYRTVRDSFRRSKGVYATSLIAHKGWLWIGTNLGVVLTIPLPRLEGVPIISTGNANVSFHGFCGPVTFLMPLMDSVQPPILPPPAPKLPKESSKVVFKEETAPSESATPTATESSQPRTPLSISLDVGDNKEPKTLPDSLLPNGVTSTSSSSIENCSPSPNGSKTLVVLRKKSSKDNSAFLRNCKTLPRGTPIPSNLRFSIDSDVYGLYGNLINVRGLEDEGRFVDPLYDSLRRSDPELNALDAKVSTIDRRLKMRMSRPRSLDLSNWSVDSKISVSSDDSGGLSMSRGGSSGSGSGNRDSGCVQLSDSSPIPPDSKNETDSNSTPDPLANNATTSRNKGTHHRQKAKNSKKASEKTVFVVVGGRGYLNMRSLAQEHFLSNSGESETKSCPHLTLWQMKT